MYRAIPILVLILTATATPVADELQVTTTKNDDRKESYRNRTETSTPNEEPNNLQADQYEYLTVDSIFTYTNTDGKQNIGVGCESDYRDFTASALKSNKTCEKLVRARFGLRRGRIFQCNFTDGKVLHYVSYGVDEDGFIVTDLTHFPLVKTASVDADSGFSVSADKNRNNYLYIPIDKVFTYTDTEGTQIVGVGCISEYRNFIQISSMRGESGEKLVRAKFKDSYSAEDPIFQCRFIVGELLRFVSYEIDRHGFIVTGLKNYPLMTTRGVTNNADDENISFNISPEPSILGRYEYLTIDSIFTYTDTDGKKKVGVGCESDYRNLTTSALLSNEYGEKLVRFINFNRGLYQCSFVDARKVLHYVTYEVDKAGYIIFNLTHLETTPIRKNGTADDGNGSYEFRNKSTTADGNTSDIYHYYTIDTIDSFFTYVNPDGKKIVGVGCISAYHNFTINALMRNESDQLLTRVKLHLPLPQGQEYKCNYLDAKHATVWIKYIADEEGLIVTSFASASPVSHAPLVVATLLGAG